MLINMPFFFSFGSKRKKIKANRKKRGQDKACYNMSQANPPQPEGSTPQEELHEQ